MTARRLLLLVPMSLAVLVACSWFWLLHTESGSRWIWDKVTSAADGALRGQLLRGDLGSGVTVQQLTFSTDTLTIETREVRLSANLDLIPLQLQISDVSIDDTDVQINTSSGAAENDDRGISIEDLSLPISLILSNASANKISLSGLAPNSDIELTQAALAGSWHQEVVIEHFSVSMLGSPELTGLPEPVVMQLRAAGDLNKLDIDVSSSPIEISVQGSISNLLNSVSWDLQARLAEATLAFGQNDTEVRVENARAESVGDLDIYSLTASATLGTTELIALQVAATGTGSTTSIDLSEMNLRNNDVDVSGDASFSWGKDWSIESHLVVAMFDLAVFRDDWPASHPLNGDISLSLDEKSLVINSASLGASDTDMSVRADGEIDLLESVVTGSLLWKNVSWPLLAETATFFSESGTISVDGTVDNWRIDGDIELGTPEMPSGKFRIDGNGDRHQVQATIINSEVLGGQVSGFGAFSWRDEQKWSANLDLSGVGLGSLNDDWPDSISGQVNGDGQLLPFELQLNFSDVRADFLGEALSANGQVEVSAGHFAASGLRLLHGESRFELDGAPFARSGLKFDIAVEDASKYYGLLDGSIAAAGQVSLNAQHPSLRIDASSPAFSFGQASATDIEINDISGEDGVVDAEIRIGQLVIQDNMFDDVVVNILADASQQSVRLNATHSEAEIEAFAVGSLDDLQQPSGWQGELHELNFTLNEEPFARLAEPAAISLSANSVTVDMSCVAGNTGMRLCAELDWFADDYVDIAADLSDVPTDLINGVVATGLKFDQLVSGDIAWFHSRESGVRGNAEITMTAGRIVGIDYPNITIDTEPGYLSFDIVDGQRLSGEAALPMPGFGHVSGQFSIPDLSQGMNSGVDGLLDLDLSDMAVLAALSPLVDSAQGEIRADLTLSGTLSKPLLVGDLDVTDGSLTYLPIGLRLSEVNLRSSLHDDGQMELSGEFRAGEGRGRIVTRADYAITGAKGFELELQGDNMTLIDVPNVTAHADLDVRINYDFENLLVDGRVLIPYARINPSNSVLTSHSESDDVIIVAGELPDDSNRQTSERDASISGSIGVAFGDDVVVELGPASAELTGNTVFTWDDNLIPVADGRYDLTGSIQVFGQLLEITEGGLRFPKIPANNPFVRIRAEREIFGNAQVKTAGVLVDGNLKQLSVEPYTRPGTTEERALTLLVTGNDFDFEQGLGAIDFGTYIAPRVFVSYGVGLFETENVIRIRYDLKRGFGVTATSGEKESGIDLSYRIER